MATLSRSRSKDSILWLTIVAIGCVFPVFFFNWETVTPAFQLYFAWIFTVNEVSLITLIGLLAIRVHRKYKLVPWSIVIRMVVTVGVIVFFLEFISLAYVALLPH